MLYRLDHCPFRGSHLYLPMRMPPKGGVVVFHGSEGGGCGWHDVEAQILAIHGYAALAFSWCGHPSYPVPGLPQDAIDINISRAARAIQWLRGQPKVKGKRVALCGFSRGAELALILAAGSMRNRRTPKIDAVAVHAATAKVAGGFSWTWNTEDKKLGTEMPDPATARAWHWRGEYLPVGEPIPIENFAGPVLLSHGRQDPGFGGPWCVEQSEELERRLGLAGRRVRTLYQAHEKHVLSAKGQHLFRTTLLGFLRSSIS